MSFNYLLPIVFLTATGSVCGAEPRLQQTQVFTAAKRLQLDRLAADVSIDTANMTGIEVKLVGSDRQIKSLRLEPHGDILRISGGTGATLSEQRFDGSGNEVVIVTSGGGSAEVSIGDRTWRSDGTATAPLQLQLRVAPQTALGLRGFVGVGEIRGELADASLDVASGELRAERLHGGELAVTGSGVIQVGGASGDLSLAVDGSGEITIGRAALDRLDAAVRGSGVIIVGGRVVGARLSVQGSGEIEVEHVDQRAPTELQGSGEIRVGNW